MELRLVQKDDIENHWDKIKPSLKKMARNWRYEQAYCELKRESAHLYLTIQNNEETGYVILQDSNFGIHVWAAYNKNNNVLVEGLEAIKQLAKKINLTRYPKYEHISFSTYRKAWEKVAPKLGFEKSGLIWKVNL